MLADVWGPLPQTLISLEVFRNPASSWLSPSIQTSQPVWSQWARDMSLLGPPRVHWTIIALIMSVWTQIQGFREKRSCIQIFALPSVNKICPWIHSSCQFGINIPLSMSHHQTNTQWNRKLAGFCCGVARSGSTTMGEICTTHPSLNLRKSSLAL